MPNNPAAPMYNGPTYLRRPQVEAITGLKKSSIYFMIGRNEFPKPHKLGRKAAG